MRLKTGFAPAVLVVLLTAIFLVGCREEEDKAAHLAVLAQTNQNDLVANRHDMKILLNKGIDCNTQFSKYAYAITYQGGKLHGIVNKGPEVSYTSTGSGLSVTVNLQGLNAKGSTTFCGGKFSAGGSMGAVDVLVVPALYYPSELPPEMQAGSSVAFEDGDGLVPVLPLGWSSEHKILAHIEFQKRFPIVNVIGKFTTVPEMLKLADKQASRDRLYVIKTKTPGVFALVEIGG